MEKEAKKKVKKTALCGLLSPNLGKTEHLHDIMHDQNGKDGVKNSGPPSDPHPSQWSKLLESSEHALNWSSLEFTAPGRVTVMEEACAAKFITPGISAPFSRMERKHPNGGSETWITHIAYDMDRF